jgi:hypothetical protein
MLELDESLGKGKLCRDATFCFETRSFDSLVMQMYSSPTRVLELVSGTNIASLILVQSTAKFP